ncbi:DUF4190 domain-containing protein [Actinomycetospora termitidis]|uniref:DUF4190 domain-containing protein n=1 Tax=Actinomycetospora termitidis TaxID=3053470 RepID=A0ABT7MC33_9PSEU|nr:DUF4190 domain-containing protein [Actinomycetospora sp. Odt1-22]MDL5157724.1 DUF4190 domain-containing protein [Actinomycetospora sp. Odt1-22]
MTDPYGQWDSNAQVMPPKPKNGMGVAALVFGILALLTCWVPIVGLVLGILAIIFGVVGRGRVRKQQATNGGVALTGLWLGVISVVLNIIATVVLGGLFLAFLGVGGGQTLQQYQDCVTAAPNAGTPAQVQQAFEQCQQQFSSQLPNLGGGEGQ